MKYVLFLCLAITVSSCKFEVNTSDEGKESTERSDESDRQRDKNRDSKVEMKDAIDQLTKSLEELQEGEKVETMPHRDLQKMLPERVNGFEKVDYEGSKSGALGYQISTAHAEYEKGNEKFEIDLVDAGSLGRAAFSFMNWLDMEVDKSSKRGFERTGEIKGFPSYEKFEKDGWSELMLFVNERYAITAKGRVDDFDDLRDAVLDLPLRKLKKE